MSAKPVEQELNSQKNNVPVAEEPKPETVEAPQFNVEEWEKKVPAIAKPFVKPIAEAWRQQDARIARLEEAMVQLGVKLSPLIEAIQARQTMAQPTSDNPTISPSLGGLDVNSILKLLPLFMGGGGTNERMQKLQEDLLQTSIDSMKTDMSVGKALKNALVSKLGGKIVGEIIP